jgi:hypothetical protein
MHYVAVEEKKAGGQVAGLSEFPGVLQVTQPLPAATPVPTTNWHQLAINYL